MDSLNRNANASVHPCVRCGACCATYRVLFHPSELDPNTFHVPADLTEKVSDDERAMLGTNQIKPRCVALWGKLGQSVECTIYARRPVCCREFRASYEDGIKNPRCDQARKGKGLKPLQPKDWPRAPDTEL